MVDAGPNGHHFTMVTGGGYTRQYHWYSLITIMKPLVWPPRRRAHQSGPQPASAARSSRTLVVDTTDFADKKLSAICAAETAMRQLVQEMRAYLNRHGLQLPWIAAEDKQAVRGTPSARP
jgi:LmbE family N-acetylglucosaminyl deacetylase